MMRKIREWAKMFICLDLLFTLAWYVVTATLGLLCLIVVLIRGEYDQVPTLLVTIVGSVAFLGFVSWIARDARKASKALRQQRKKGKPRPDGDMSDVAEMPERPPWMG